MWIIYFDLEFWKKKSTIGAAYNVSRPIVANSTTGAAYKLSRPYRGLRYITVRWALEAIIWAKSVTDAVRLLARSARARPLRAATRSPLPLRPPHHSLLRAATRLGFGTSTSWEQATATAARVTKQPPRQRKTHHIRRGGGPRGVVGQVHGGAVGEVRGGEGRLHRRALRRLPRQVPQVPDAPPTAKFFVSGSWGVR